LLPIRLEIVTKITRWLDRVDPGVHRRITGPRLVTAYGIAAMLGALHDSAQGLPDAASLGSLAGSFALWGSVSEGLVTGDLPTVIIAGAIAALAAIVPRMLSGPAEQPPPFAEIRQDSVALSMGFQALAAAIVIVALDHVVGLTEAAWAIIACTYVIAGSASGKLDRVRRRIIGTAIGVPMGLTFLPLAGHAPILAWAAAALAMVIYAMALPVLRSFGNSEAA
jgi:hypothetical protein